MVKDRLVITDLLVHDPLCGYFNYKNIDFDFLPEVQGVPVVDVISDKIKGKADPILILGLCNRNSIHRRKEDTRMLDQLYNQRSVYNDFLELRQKITLIIYDESDVIVELLDRWHYNPNFASWLNGLKPLILLDGRASEMVKKYYKDCEFVELHTPHLRNIMVYPEFNTLKNHKPTTDFFCLMTDKQKKHCRRLLNDKIIANGLQDNMIYRFNEKNEKTFDDLGSMFQKRVVDNQYWKDGLPPVDYYNQTNLELAVETICHDHDESFFMTEKTAKPITMTHPFMVLANKHFLKNLRELGFRTFHDHIDESYDQEPMIERRIEIIVKNLLALKVRTHKLYEDTKEIREHNHLNLQHQAGEYLTKYWRTMDKVWRNI